MSCHFYPSLGWLVNRSSDPSGFGRMGKRRQWLLKEEVLEFWGSSLDLPSSKPGSFMTCNFFPPTSAECPSCTSSMDGVLWDFTAPRVLHQQDGGQQPLLLNSQQNVAPSIPQCWAFSTSVPLWLWSLVGGCFRASLTIYRFNSIHLSHLQY